MGNLTEAEIAYRKALQANARSADAAYNLGYSLYKQQKFPEATEHYQAAVSDEKDKEKAAMVWHNVGNVFMSGKDYQKSIEAYKEALRKNPLDDETRYNLALAQKLLENQQNKDKNKDQNKDKNKDQNKKDQQKNKDQNKDQNKQQQNKDQQQQNQDQQQQQQNQDQMQKQNAEQILDAMMQNERDTQDKVRAQQIQQQKQRKTDKNW
jgi:tetratricopeptide (TPR) repeat protein